MNQEHPVTRLELYKLVTDSLDTRASARIRTHVASCERCRTRLAELHREREEFLARMPFEETITAVPAPRRIRYRPAQLYALAAGLVLMVAGVLVYQSIVPAGVTRVKGDVGIELFVQGPAGNPLRRPGHIYHPGERIQIVYSCAEANRFMLLSIDEGGRVSTYYPAAGDSSIVLAGGSGVPLPNSIILDDYRGEELFVALFSTTPRYLPAVTKRLVRAFEQAPSLDALEFDAEGGEVVRSVLITKEEVSR